MNRHLKKIIRLTTYSALLVLGGVIVVFPFIKKGMGFTSDVPPILIQEVSADAPSGGDGDSTSDGGGAGGDDDGI